MTTDEERREVARLARALAKNEFDFECDSVAKAVGANRHFPAQAWGRLADLIDPDCGTQETASSRVPECDRDALLRLARYMDKDVAETEAHFSNVISTKSVSDYARRIREAVGVER